MYQWWKYSGFSGLVFVAMTIAALVLQSGSPGADTELGSARDYFAGDGQRYLIGAFLLGLASFLFFVPFVSGLSYFVRLGEAGPQINGRLVLIAGVLLVALAAAASIPAAALAFAGSTDIDDGTLRLLLTMDHVGYRLLPFAMGLLIGATSVVIVFDNLFWPWLGVIGFVVAIIDFIAPLGLATQDVGGVFGVLHAVAVFSFAAWMVLVSYALMTRYEVPNTI